MRFTYEDRRPTYDKPRGYIIPNENISGWFDITADMPAFNKAVAIASGGEVALSVLLPKASESVIAVDHAYCSLCWAYIKAAMLEEFGGERIKELLRGPNEMFHDAIKDIKTALPPELRAKMNYTEHHEFTAVRSSQLSAYWQLIPTSSLDEAREKLDLLKLVHGDILDFTDTNVDVTYISNCNTHTNFKGGSPHLNDLEKIVKPGGTILYACSTYSRDVQQPPGAKIKTVPAICNHTGMQWVMVAYPRTTES